MKLLVGAVAAIWLLWMLGHSLVSVYGDWGLLGCFGLVCLLIALCED